VSVAPGQRLAVIGTGVSGLVSAWLLRDRFDLTVFEASDRIGGHVHTRILTDSAGEPHAVDSGFIVFNHHNYPLFTALLAELGVRSRPSDMGFSVRCDRPELEFSGNGLKGLFAQRRNLISPRFLGMLRDVRRFFARAPAILRHPAPAGTADMTIADYVDHLGCGSMFRDRFILPMGAAIWSAPAEEIRRFPAAHFVRFFDHHRMLQVGGRPVWRVIDGGSKSYVDALIRPFRDRIRVGTAVRRVERTPEGVRVSTDAGTETFGGVVFAVHSDQALRLLADPSPAETEILGAIPFQSNPTALHTDESVLPRRKAARAAWNYRVTDDDREPIAVTYDMNVLQGLRSPDRFLVTLNPRAGEIRADTVRERMDYEHPVFRREGVAAQSRHGEISGVRNTFYAGAWWGFGFHEDGVRSAHEVSAQLGGRRLEAAG